MRLLPARRRSRGPVLVAGLAVVLAAAGLIAANLHDTPSASAGIGAVRNVTPSPSASKVALVSRPDGSRSSAPAAGSR